MNRRRFLSFLGLGAVAGPAAASAAPTFIEAQPPSAVNDAFRAEMARIAGWRDRNGEPCIFARAATRQDISPYKLRL